MNHLFYLLSDPMLIVESGESRWYIRDVNQAFAAFSGFKKSDLLLLDPAAIISAPESGLCFAGMLRQLSDDQSFTPSLECRLVTKFSTPAAVQLACRKLQAAEQASYVLICKDLRETKWIDEYALNHKIMIACTINERFGIQSFKHYYAPVGQPASAYTNKPIFELVPEQERNKLKRALEHARSNLTTESLSFQLKLGDRFYNADAVIQPFYNGNRSFKSFALILQNMQINAQEDDPSYKLRMLMLSKNISVTSLAQSTLISLTTISKIRNGKIKKPQRLTAELIAGELGVRPEAIWSSFKR